uniref:Histone H1.3 (Fragments) n=1 Tax=Triticum aestivum TaxID=4565 RepID=H13_WHEAT|nr:RecName: Full=Histone H1.3 [Triticum aestivum]
MVSEAITALKERTGSMLTQIKKLVAAGKLTK